jgi:phenylalanyl-tRNA synthetase beta chain
LFKFDKNQDKNKFIKIINPIGEDLSVMRTSLLPSAVRTACGNINRKNNDGRLFELAKVYNPKTLPLQELPVEKLMLSLVAFGQDEDFFNIKGVVEGIFSNFLANIDVKYLASNAPYMHPTRAADMFVNGEYIGVVGQVHPSIIAELGADKPVFCAEIDFELLKKYFQDKISVNLWNHFYLHYFYSRRAYSSCGNSFPWIVIC